MKVTFVLPGIARKASGGHKVVYTYANYLAASGHEVQVIHAKLFRGIPAITTGFRGIAGAAMHLFARSMRPSWFDLDHRVKVRNVVYPRSSMVASEDVLIATAVQTAQFVADQAAESQAQGVYFIQHFENWALSTEAVEASWRLNLRRVVIAPWLEEVGNRLGVETVLVPNAIDTTEFPAGPPIHARRRRVAAMISDAPFKRADLVAETFRMVASSSADAEFVAFGVVPRPAELPDFVEYTQSPSPAALRSIYQGARVYLCASDAEGWHLPPAEAMASGAALVSTAIGGVQVYAAGVAHFVAPGDASELTRGVNRLLEDEAECARLASAGQLRLSQYTPTDAGRAFETAILGDA